VIHGVRRHWLLWGLISYFIHRSFNWKPMISCQWDLNCREVPAFALRLCESFTTSDYAVEFFIRVSDCTNTLRAEETFKSASPKYFHLVVSAAAHLSQTPHLRGHCDACRNREHPPGVRQTTFIQDQRFRCEIDSIEDIMLPCNSALYAVSEVGCRCDWSTCAKAPLFPHALVRPI